MDDMGAQRVVHLCVVRMQEQEVGKRLVRSKRSQLKLMLTFFGVLGQICSSREHLLWRDVLWEDNYHCLRYLVGCRHWRDNR